jgi:hypothetical protein
MRRSVRNWKMQGRILCATTIILASASAIWAQDGPPMPPPPGNNGGFGGGPGGPGGPGFPGGPGGPGGQGGQGFRPQGQMPPMGPPMGPPVEISAATVPVTLLIDGLKLSDEQEVKVRGILDKLRDDRRALLPGPGGQGGPSGPRGNAGQSAPGGPGGPGMMPPDPEAMRAQMDKVRAREKKAAGDVEAVLNGDQKKKLGDLLKDANLLRDAGLPIEVAPSLKLTDEQRTKLKALAPTEKERPQQPPAPGQFGQPGEGPRGGGMGNPQGNRREVTRKALAILTDAQREVVEKYRQEHPRPQMPGGQGGPGGPGGQGMPGGPGQPGGFGGGPGGPGGFGGPERPGPGGPGGPGEGPEGF